MPDQIAPYEPTVAQKTPNAAKRGITLVGSGEKGATFSLSTKRDNAQNL